MILPITALGVGLLAFWYLWQAMTVTLARGKYKISVGTGEHETMQRVVRAHGNTAEYAPLALLILAALEFHGLEPVLLYIFLTAILLGRFFHRRGMLYSNGKARVLGMQLTIFPIIFGAGTLVYTWFVQTFLF